MIHRSNAGALDTKMPKLKWSVYVFAYFESTQKEKIGASIR